MSTLDKDFYKVRTVAETIEVYDQWAAEYDRELTAKGYHTPRRIAEALAQFVPTDAKILDFGCGTGVSGMALKVAGFTQIDGTDISEGMLAEAATKGIYDRLWQSEPATVPATPGTYAAMIATGVISIGAAPPETLSDVLSALAPDGILALSFNEATLAEGSHENALQDAIENKMVRVLFRENGPHLDDLNMTADVIVLKRL